MKRDSSANQTKEREIIDSNRAGSRYNWRGQWVVNSKDRWKNLKIIRNRHAIRESYIKPGKLTFHLITVYMGAPSRQQTIFSGRNYNILQTAGHIAVIPAFCTLQSWYDDVEQDDIYLHLEPDFVQRVAEGSDLNPDATEIVTSLENRNPIIHQLAQMAFDELQLGREAMGSNLYADSLANMLAVQLLRNHSSRPLPEEKHYSNGLSNRRLTRVLELINSDLSADLSLTELAEAAGLSEYYFLRLFKKSTNLTPHQYVLNQRIEKAKELLRKTDLTITEISYILGFSTPAHFTYQFRRRTGVPPSSLR
ncbi:MAG: AraC family transcriptional regulator [Pyrinomonadaceae bacterium]